MSKENEDVYFVSDPHFNHANIIKYCGRDFCLNDFERAALMSIPKRFMGKGWTKEDVAHIRISRETVEKHDNILTNNWNEKVPQKGIVYCLGDFLFGSEDLVYRYLDRLNFSEFYFIFGNHDKAMHRFFKKYGNHIDRNGRKIINHGGLFDTVINGKQITMCHFPMRSWEASHYGSWQLFGHEHHTLPDDPTLLSIDVGIDGVGYNYSPLSWDDVCAAMRNKSAQNIMSHRTHRENDMAV